MKNIKIHLILILSLFSCDYFILEADLPNDESKLVINSFFHPDSTVEVYIYEGLSVLDTRDGISPNNVDLKLFNEQGNQVAIFIKSDTDTNTVYSPYKSNYYPLAGEKYSIEAELEGFPKAFSEEIIPTDSAIVTNTVLKRLDLVPDSIKNSTRYSLLLLLDDPSGNDFYEIIVQERFRSLNGPAYGNLEISSKDPVFNLFPTGFSLIMDDKLFNGQPRTINLEFESFKYGCIEGEPCYDDDIRLIVRKTSESYFKYNSTYDLYVSLNENPLAEPVHVYSNITNGFGIFAGYQSSIFPLEVPKD